MLALWGVAGVDPSTLTRFLFAQIGMYASTPPNTYNTVAQQLQQKEQELIEREKTLREQDARLKAREDAEARVARYALLGGGVLAGLISLNFLLDWRRKRKVRVHVVARAPEEVFKVE